MSHHFINAMQQAGIECQEPIVADGTIHQFSVEEAVRQVQAFFELRHSNTVLTGVSI
jgi:hypothetical protein